MKITEVVNMEKLKTDMVRVFAYIPRWHFNRINDEARKYGIRFSEAFRRILDRQMEEKEEGGR